MKYPLRTNYEIAVKNLNVFIHDPVLKSGKAMVQKTNPNFLRCYSGGKAVVFEIQTNPQKYALKCWVEDLGDLKYRYKAIDEYLKQSQLPYFVDFSYIEQGILVNGKKFPIVRMEWVDGINLKTFIDNNVNQTNHISDLAQKFLEMIKSLHKNKISHGDLQHGNIMIRKDGTIGLIDYDSLYVPQLSNEADNIKGIPGYQHPKRNNLSKLNPKVDYFSELVIYLSLITIAKEPKYWQSIKDEERLLFSDDDLANPNTSEIFKKLKNHSSEVIQYFTIQLENFCKEPNLEKLVPLENVADDYRGIWDIIPNGKQSQPNITLPSPIVDNIVDFPSTPTPTPTTPPNDDGIWDRFNKPPNFKWEFPPSEKEDHGSDTIPSTISGSKTNKKNNESIWDKFTKLVSSIWDRIVNWLPF